MLYVMTLCHILHPLNNILSTSIIYFQSDCKHDSCNGHGTCRNIHSGHSCTCHHGYEGPSCSKGMWLYTYIQYKAYAWRAAGMSRFVKFLYIYICVRFQKRVRFPKHVQLRHLPPNASDFHHKRAWFGWRENVHQIDVII